MDWMTLVKNILREKRNTEIKVRKFANVIVIDHHPRDSARPRVTCQGEGTKDKEIEQTRCVDVDLAWAGRAAADGESGREGSHVGRLQECHCRHDGLLS